MVGHRRGDGTARTWSISMRNMRWIFFQRKIVAVIGGGNSAVEEAIFLTKFASKVYLIHRRDTLRAEKILQDKLFSNDKIEVIWNKKTEQIISEKNKKQVESISVTDTKTNEKKYIKSTRSICSNRT